MEDKIEDRKQKRVKRLQNSLEKAETSSKKREFEIDETSRAQAENLKRSLLDELLELTGEKHYIGKDRNAFSGEPFNQVIHRNLDMLTRIGYLTMAEESFLFRIQAYLEFKSNVIICRKDKFTSGKKKEEFILPKAANIADIAEMISRSRENVSRVMNSLKKKEILLNPEGAGHVLENGRTVTPRTWVVNPYLLITAPRKNEVALDTMTIRLFQYSLRNLKDENGKKAELPVRFF